MNYQNVTDSQQKCCSCNDQKCCVGCISWSGVFAGALVAIGLSFLLNLFAVAIGLSAFRMSAQGAATFAIGGYAGMVVGIVAVMYVSGWIAGFIGRAHCATPQCGALYGFVAWCVALVMLVFIAMQTSDVVTVNFQPLANHYAVVAQTTDNTVNDQQNVVAPSKNASKANVTTSTVNANKAAETLGLSLFLTFALFFIGAVSSALGGYCGTKSKCSTSCQ